MALGSLKHKLDIQGLRKYNLSLGKLPARRGSSGREVVCMEAPTRNLVHLPLAGLGLDR